jgi:uncharacterized protein YjbI with pentapeptide repeats
MKTTAQPDWDSCAEPNCGGIQLAVGDRCLAHAAEQDVVVELKRISAEGAVDARGVRINRQLLDSLLTAVSQDGGRPILKGARFNGATFEGEARFDEATFQGETKFSEARFEGTARFGKATFQGRVQFKGAIFKCLARFGGATFQGPAEFEHVSFQDLARFGGAAFKSWARFDEASFQDQAWFNETIFQDQAAFGWATFGGEARFGQATFQGLAWFDKATFQGTACFDKAIFQGAARFSEAKFQTEASFDKATFHSTARFSEATFEQTRQLGPMLVRKQLGLDQATFKQRVQIEAAAAAVCCQRPQFPVGVQLRLRWASVVLDETELIGPSIVTSVPPFPLLDEECFARAWARLPPPPHDQHGRPRLLSACHANLAGLTISNVDLRACRFCGAYNMDKLRLEGEPMFARAPGVGTLAG